MPAAGQGCNGRDCRCRDAGRRRPALSRVRCVSPTRTDNDAASHATICLFNAVSLGVADHYALDDFHALTLARSAVRNLNRVKRPPVRTEQTMHAQPYRPRCTSRSPRSRCSTRRTCTALLARTCARHSRLGTPRCVHDSRRAGAGCDCSRRGRQPLRRVQGTVRPHARHWCALRVNRFRY